MFASSEGRLMPIRSRNQRRTRFVVAENKRNNKIVIENHTSVTTSCEFDRTGKFLLSANNRGQIYICDTVNEFERLAYLKGHVMTVTEVHFSMDSSKVYSSSYDGSVIMWDTYRGCEMGEFIGHTDCANTVQCSPQDPSFICSGSSDKTVRIWDNRSGQCLTVVPTNDSVSATCFSKCGQYVFCAGSRNGNIGVTDLRMNEVLVEILGHTDSVTGLEVSPCGKYLASCAADNTIRKWDISTVGNLGGVPRRHQMSVIDQNGPFHLIRCAWSSDSNYLSCGRMGRQVFVFDSSLQIVVYRLDGHKGMPIDVAFHPVKPLLMSTGTDGYLILHDI